MEGSERATVAALRPRTRRTTRMTNTKTAMSETRMTGISTTASG
jgi:hypothetical protein